MTVKPLQEFSNILLSNLYFFLGTYNLVNLILDTYSFRLWVLHLQIVLTFNLLQSNFGGLTIDLRFDHGHSLTYSKGLSDTPCIIDYTKVIH